MKTRLPKMLLLVLGVAAMPHAVAAESGLVLDPTATMVTPGTIVGKDGDVTITAIPDSWKVSNEVTTPIKHAQPYLKDGVDTTLTVQNVKETVANPFYVREGKSIIKDSEIKVDLVSSTQAMINVAGNQAELTLDNTKFEDVDCEAYLEVGGPDGEGILNLNGDSRVRVVSLLAGFHKDANWNNTYPMINSTAATTEGGERYKNGVYTYNANAGRYFGAATININKGAELELGTTAFLVEAVVNVNGGLLDVGADNTVTPMVLGRQNGCSTELNITNGGTVQTNTYVDVQTGDYYSGAEAASTKISVSGTGSKLLVGQNLQVGYNASQSKEGQSLFEVLDGGSVEAKSITLGRADANELKQLIATVGAGSTIEAEELQVLGGADVTNKGTIEAEISVDGGTFTMENGKVAGGLTATSGTINLSGNVTFTGSVVLGSPMSSFALNALSGEVLTLNITDGSIINVDELTIGDNTEICVVLTDASEDTDASFTLVGSDAAALDALTETLEGVDMKVVDADGNAIETGTVSFNTTITVPEPTTATLSLLALAALAARRRRK